LLEQLVGELVGFVTLKAGAGDGERQTAQVFDECESQSDSDGPQLADREWRDCLI